MIGPFTVREIGDVGGGRQGVLLIGDIALLRAAAAIVGQTAWLTTRHSHMPSAATTEAAKDTDRALAATLRDLVAWWLDADAAAITAETRLVEDLAGDSLTRIALAIEIENEFCVELSDEDIEAATTFGALAALVETRIMLPGSNQP